jgi:hypothetical protein
MGPFSASLRVAGDTSALPAQLLVEDGRLRIESGDQAIGEWPLADIDLNRTEVGYRMRAEGEQLFLSVQDIAGFDEAVNLKTKRRRRANATAKANGTKVANPEKARTKKAKKTKEPKQAGDPGFLDRWLIAAEKRFGALLPDWVFTRLVIYLLVVGLVVTIFFPGIISGLMLIGGLLTVVFGSVLYTDGRMATKVLPGRMTPAHVLIAGVGILVVGVLVGVIGR